MDVRRVLSDTDGLLRGRYTRPEDLAEGKIAIPTRTLLVAAVSCGAIYGVFMGLFAVLRESHPSVGQLLATMVKVPLLFVLTLVVTFPSLYVFSTLADSRLFVVPTLRLVLGAVAVNLALLASLGPVTGFFTLSTTSYPFMLVLNVVFFGVAGIAGLVFLWKALRAVFDGATAPAEPPGTPEPPVPAAEGGEEEAGAPAAEVRRPPVARRAPPPTPATLRARRVYIAWFVVYGIVGAQMAWILRPFVGTPHLAFTLFRLRESSFFEAFFRALGRLLS